MAKQKVKAESRRVGEREAGTAAVVLQQDARWHEQVLRGIVEASPDIMPRATDAGASQAEPDLDQIMGVVAGGIATLPGLTAPDAQFDEYLEKMETALVSRASAMLDAVMHDPRVVGPMSRWIGIEDVVMDPGFGDATLHLLPVTKRELIEDYCQASKDISQTVLYRYVVREAYGTPGGIPYLFAVADIEMGVGADDVMLAEFFARIGERAHMVVFTNVAASVFTTPEHA